MKQELQKAHLSNKLRQEKKQKELEQKTCQVEQVCIGDIQKRRERRSLNQSQAEQYLDY